MLTNEQCDEFRCHPDDFYSRVRAVYDLGRKHALEDAAKKLEREKKTYKWVSEDKTMPIIGKEITPPAEVAALLTSIRDGREVEKTGINPEMDIVEKLKQQAAEIAEKGLNGWGNTMLEAADNIEQLRAVVKLQHDMTTELSNFAFK